MKDNTPLTRFNEIYGYCQAIASLFEHMDRKEYRGVREYMKEKFEVDFGYGVPGVIKAKVQAEKAASEGDE